MMTIKNEYHLRHFMFHFSFQLITMINMSLHLLLNIKLPIVVIVSGRSFAFVFFFLFIKSFLEKKKARLTFIYFVPSLLIILIDFLNSSGIRLFTFIGNQIIFESIMGFNSDDFIGKEDLFVILCLNTLFFTCLIFYKYYQILKSEILNNKTKDAISNLFKYYYVLITITSISTLFILGLFLFNYKLTFLFVSLRILGILTILILIVRPEIIRKVSQINNSDEKDEGLAKIYNQIKSLFSEGNQYLNSDYTSASISANTGIRNELIRNSIKTHSEMSVPMFINSYRIEYAIKLINEDFLKNYSMNALAEKSGFSSQENFNRVFKLLKTVTPSEYFKLRDS
jgi:AraC-like DNA-binding protein